MHDHFGIGLRAELHALRLQALAQLQIVLHNPVVDDHDLPIVAEVRMGVLLAGLPVRRPAGVPDAHRAADRLVQDAPL